MRWSCWASVAVAALAAVAAEGKDPPPAKKPVKKTFLSDDFGGKQLSKRRWEPVRIHDTRSDRIAVEGGELVVSLDTLKTDDRTVKLRGVASRQTFEVPAVDPPLRICVTIDWNDQSNGSYLTAGFALMPVAPAKKAPRQPKKAKTAKQAKTPKKKVWTAPHRAREALAFEVVGVPPAKNARPFLWRRTAGGLRPLFTEGWPQPKREDRVGRRIRRPKIVLAITRRRLQLYEDGRQLHEGPSGFSGRFRLWLFVTGHSNYPARTIKFDDVRIERPIVR